MNEKPVPFEDIRREVIEKSNSTLRQGFNTMASTREFIIDVLKFRFGEDTVSAILDEVLPQLSDAYETQKKSWPEITDCDRLDAAFEELNAKGIMARHHWSCCGSCGTASMPTEFNRLGGKWRGVPITGYVFYDVQGTERALKENQINLDYGSSSFEASKDEYESLSCEVARVACQVLRSHGFKPEWAGTFVHSIDVTLKWQRRHPPRRFGYGDKSVD
jgi:hypothetical protein